MKSRVVMGMLVASLLASVALAAGASFAGSPKSKIFHKPGCRYYSSPGCTTVFDTRDAAVAAGYRACKVCKP